MSWWVGYLFAGACPDSAMFTGIVESTSPTRQRVNKSQRAHSLARRACNGAKHGAVQLGSGKETRDRLGERPGVNRPVERPTGRLTPTARHGLVGRLFVRWGLRTARGFRDSRSQPAGTVAQRDRAGENPVSGPCCGRLSPEHPPAAPDDRPERRRLGRSPRQFDHP
jgi:hypothetical protein